MTGTQVSSNDSTINAVAMLPIGELSGEWSDFDVIRAIVSAIPADMREKALAAVRSIVGCGNDTVVGALTLDTTVAFS